MRAVAFSRHGGEMAAALRRLVARVFAGAAFSCPAARAQACFAPPYGSLRWAQACLSSTLNGLLTDPICPRSASSSSAFLSISSCATGTGPGVVQFSAANAGAAARSGTVTVAGQTATINQPGTGPLLPLSRSADAIQWRQPSPRPASVLLSIFTNAASLPSIASAAPARQLVFREFRIRNCARRRALQLNPNLEVAPEPRRSLSQPATRRRRFWYPQYLR